MVKFLSLSALMGIVLTSCTHNFKPKPTKRDTVLVTYQATGVGWRFDRALRLQSMGRKFVSDSGLDAKEDYVTTFWLSLPPTKADSIIDSATHKLLRVNIQFSPTPLPDSLNHYIHILDSTK